jgi:pyruvate dehydrogenase E2 component (dihydrolipoamide acetyltransferase)
MEKKISLPRLGETMETGVIGKWLVKEGEAFSRGQIIAEIESDKTTVELPALENGTLTKILFNEGDEMNVGEDIAIFDSS